MAMGKNYTVAIWDVTYYLIDEDDYPLLNEDGSVNIPHVLKKYMKNLDKI